MKKFKKILAIVLAMAILSGLGITGAIAAEGDEEKIVCFTFNEGGTEVVEATDDAPQYQLTWVIMDGKLQQIKCLQETMLLGFPGWNTWYRPATVTFNADGYVYKTRDVPGLLNGIGIEKAADGKIKLGVYPVEYKYANDVAVYIIYKRELVEDFEVKITDLVPAWDAEWHILLNEKDEIQTMYVAPGNPDSDPALGEAVKNLNVSEGPVDEDTGLTTRYLYYKPDAAEEEKYPLVIWLHGMWGGVNDWEGMLAYNDIARFTTEPYQSAFEAGGAYVMVPLANESLKEGHNMSWNQKQVGCYELALDEFIENNPNIDTDRIYIGGYSMGGGMTWLAIRSRPDFYAAAFPCAPIGMYQAAGEELNEFASLPIWTTHGLADPVVAIKGTNDIRPTLEKNAARTGTDTRFSIWAEGFLEPNGVNKISNDHCSWVPTLNNFLYNDGTKYKDIDGVEVKSTLIEWMNEQTRSANLLRAKEGAFSDVTKADWFFDYVIELADAGIVNGVGDFMFNPDGTTKVGETLKLVMLATGYEEQAATDAHWASGYLAKAAQDGLIDADVDLDAAIDRLAAAQIAAKAAKLESTLDESPFSDCDDAAVLALFEAGVIEGNPDGTYAPGSNLKRSEMCKIIFNLMEI